ncbi:MAG TPA: DUF2892 domain-containing protein [Rubricoccaceae bacterium]|nr:DUF2892 domain-containing protein [Rubricoccaceae bacterium]
MAHAPSAPKGLPVNVGPTDRAIRVGVGLFVLALGLAYESWWGLAGLVPLATGLAGRCPAYALLGVGTCAPDRR